jgi:hypothetical protein
MYVVMLEFLILYASQALYLIVEMWVGRVVEYEIVDVLQDEV